MRSEHLVQPLHSALHNTSKSALRHLPLQLRIRPAQVIGCHIHAGMLLVPVRKTSIGFAANGAQGAGDKGDDQENFVLGLWEES